MKDGDFEEIYHGPRRFEPMGAGNLGSVGSDTDAAFALGRELYKQGRSLSYLKVRGKKRSREWGASLRKGYMWQESR